MIILICSLLMSCGNVASDNSLKVKYNSDYNEIKTAKAENLYILTESDVPFKFNSYIKISERQYIFMDSNGLEDNGTNIHLYDLEQGVMLENTIYGINAMSIIYDEKHQNIL